MFFITSGPDYCDFFVSSENDRKRDIGIISVTGKSINFVSSSR